MERWEDESDDDYAARLDTARKVAAARARYEQSDEYKEARARAAAYHAGKGNFTKVNNMASDDIEDLREQLEALQGGIGQSFEALNAGMMDNTAAIRAGLGLDTTPEARAWAEAVLREADPYEERERDLLRRAGEQTKSTAERLRNARAKLAAMQPNKTDFWLAMAQGAAMPNEGGKLGWTGNVAAAVRPSIQAMRDFELEKQSGLDAYDQEIEQTARGDLDMELKLLMARRKAWDERRELAARLLGKNVPGAGAAGAGAKKLDQEVAGEFMDWATKNGPVFERSIDELARAQDMIRRAKAQGKNISGRELWTSYLSLFGDWGEKAESIANPLASDIRNQVLNTVQQTLRPTLGAQFTEREGQRVLARAYDPLKPEEVNIARIQALLTQIQKQAANSRSIMEWFIAHDGDMSGFKMPADEAAAFEQALYDAMDAAERSLGLDNGYSYLPPGTIDLRNYKPAAAEQAAPPAEEKPLPPGTPIEIEPGEKKKERSFFDRVWPFAKGGAVKKYAEGGSVEDEEIDAGPASGEIVVAILPDGSTGRFSPGSTPEQILAWYQENVEGPRRRRENLLNLGASAAAGLGGAGIGFTGYRIGEGLMERIPKSPIYIRPGERRFVDAANRDKLDLSDAGNRLAELQGRFRIPAVGLDVLPTESRGLINEAMRSGTPATQELQAALKGRNRDARAVRLPDAVDRATKADPFLEQQDKLRKARSASADPLYSALDNDPWVKSKDLDTVSVKNMDQDFVAWMMGTKEGRTAFDRAKDIWELDKKNAGVSPVKTSGIGMPIAYDIRFLDLVKQQLYKLEAAGDANFNTALIGKMRKSLVDQLDRSRPDYAEARAAYEEGSRPLNSLMIGRGGPDVRDLTYNDNNRVVSAKGYLEMSPDEARRYIDGFSQIDELENLRSGVAEALNRELRGTSSGSNAARRLLDNPDRMALLEILLEPRDFNQFRKTLEHEAEAWDTSDEFGRKAASARGKARGAPVSEGYKAKEAAKSLPKKIISLPFRAAGAPIRWALGLDEKGSPGNPAREFNPKEAEDIVRIAATRRRQDLDKLAKAAGRRRTRVRRAGKAGLVTGVGTAGATAYKNFSDEDEE